MFLIATNQHLTLICKLLKQPNEIQLFTYRGTHPDAVPEDIRTKKVLHHPQHGGTLTNHITHTSRSTSGQESTNATLARVCEGESELRWSEYLGVGDAVKGRVGLVRIVDGDNDRSGACACICGHDGLHGVHYELALLPAKPPAQPHHNLHGYFTEDYRTHQLSY